MACPPVTDDWGIADFVSVDDTISGIFFQEHSQHTHYPYVRLMVYIGSVLFLMLGQRRRRWPNIKKSTGPRYSLGCVLTLWQQSAFPVPLASASVQKVHCKWRPCRAAGPNLMASAVGVTANALAVTARRSAGIPPLSSYCGKSWNFIRVYFCENEALDNRSPQTKIKKMER